MSPISSPFGLSLSFLSVIAFSTMILFRVFSSGQEHVHVSPPPRGVHPDLASFYEISSFDPSALEEARFQCLDGSQVIPFLQVNDDYCDCPDGSDEPGTSACSNAHFFCSNVGHESRLLVSSRVNDGICDCCDGSDEWASSKACPDECMEMGRAAREEAERRAKIEKEGNDKKMEMSRQGKEEKGKMMEEIKAMEEELQKIEPEQSLKEAAKTEAEEKEKVVLDAYNEKKEQEKEKREEEEKRRDMELAEETFASVDGDGDGQVTKEEMMARSDLFDQNKDGAVSSEEADFFLSGNEVYNKEDFLQMGWLLIKPLLSASQEQSGQEEPPPAPVSEEEPLTSGQVEELDNFPGDAMDDDDFEGDYPDDYERFDDEDHLQPPQPPTPAPQEQPTDDYDDETRALVQAADLARSEYEEVRGRVRDIEDKIKNLKSAVDTDYGPEEEFYVLNGKCFEFTDNEYTYKLCPFDHSSQRPKHGGSETRLGSWDRWDNNYREMRFSGGQSCWNGPQRSMKARIQCGLESVVISVTEPSKCEYEAVFETPAACSDPGGQPTIRHDEL